MVGLSRSSAYYVTKEREDGPLRAALKKKAGQRRRWGYRRLTVLLRREGFRDNHKRIERIYREEKLQVKRRIKKQTARWRGESLKVAERANECWSLDFIHDSLWDGRRLRFLTVEDDYTRENLAIEADSSLPGQRVIRVLERVSQERGLPERLLMDNGPEFIGKAVDEWAYLKGVKLQFIEPGKPMQNGYTESFHGKFRDECLNEHWFLNLADARKITSEYRQDYNHVRPHQSLKYQTPVEFAAKCRQQVAAPFSPQGGGEEEKTMDINKQTGLIIPIGLS